MIFTILAFLFMLKRHQRFDGQLFFAYIMLYAVGRGIIELFRGDEERGYIIEGVLSHSQFISILIILVTGLVYYRFKKNRSAKA